MLQTTHNFVVPKNQKLDGSERKLWITKQTRLHNSLFQLYFYAYILKNNSMKKPNPAVLKLKP